VAEGGQLPRASHPGRARADHGDTLSGRSGRNVPRKDAFLEGPVRREALERRNLDRRPTLMDEDACAFAEKLDRADTGAGAAEKILGQDRLGRLAGLVSGERADERRHVDVGRAGD
jgi:hypothetical protein